MYGVMRNKFATPQHNSLLGECGMVYSFTRGFMTFDKKRGETIHDNERTELRLRDLEKIWVLALAHSSSS